jgi:hypothetical protein
VSRQDEEALLPEAPISGGRSIALGALAAAVHGLFDAVTWPSPLTRPPYLRLEDMPEVFAMLSPLGVGIATSAVSGIIAALAIVAVEPARGRRTWTLGLVLAAFWLFSALLTQAVWLRTSWALAATSLPFALPRGLLIAWLVGRLAPGAGEASPR